jgi:cobalt-precorrin-7 (C5)-methyltransferase
VTSDASDPADDATSTPERLAPADPVHVVGIGPGDPAFLTPRGRRRITRADVVFGFETVVSYVRSHVGGTVLSCGNDDEGETLGTYCHVHVESGAFDTFIETL